MTGTTGQSSCLPRGEMECLTKVTFHLFTKLDQELGQTKTNTFSEGRLRKRLQQ